MYGWSIPGAAPLIDVLSPRNVHYLLHGNFSNFEKVSQDHVLN
jgi:hypothetical protein